MFATGIVCAVLGWLARQLFYAVKELNRDLSSLQKEINRDYVRYDRLKDSIEPIMDALAEIKSVLAGKMDKK